MSSRARVPTALIISVLVTASLPGPAAADGLPAGVDATPVSAPGGEVEYTTKGLRRGTLVLARERSSGRLVRKTRLRGSWAVPAVAYDGSASGLSADGRTLVLISPRKRFPRVQTSFVILDPERLRPRRVLRGATGPVTASGPTTCPTGDCSPSRSSIRESLPTR